MYRLQCFGAAVVKAPDGQEVHFRSRKHLALLLYLTAHPQRAHVREQLAALLWVSDEAHARHSLSQALYDIRRRLRPVELQARRGMLSLREGVLEYEGAMLEEAVRTGELSRVPGLFRGGFASNLERLSPRFDRWLESERSRYQTIAQMALRRYAEECDRQGRWGEMCLTALRLVRLDPLDEAAHRALMRALWLHGDQQSALQHFSEIEEFLVRELPEGISEQTTKLVQRIRSSRPPARSGGEEEPEDPPLVGREAEFERLRAAMEQLRAGHGGMVIVRGEAGIGKTRLIQELVRVAPMEGIVRLSSRCYSAEQDVAYGPIVDGVEPLAEARARAGDSNGKRYYQLGHLFPDLFALSIEQDPQGMDADIRRRRLYEEVADLIRQSCRENPILWIIEDIQWIDGSSASLLHYVARRLSRSPLLIIASLRSEVELSDALRPLVAGEGTPVQPTLLRLAPLPHKAIRELVCCVAPGSPSAQALEFAERYSGGNPFYAIEILRAAESLEESESPSLPTRCLSERLRHLLAARLRGISQPSLRLLEATAILERHASPKNLAALTDTSVADLTTCIDELEKRGLIEQKSTRLAFRHDLLREFVYHNQASFRRTTLHLASAELLARRGDVGPATLAIHFSRGGDEARTYEFALRAVEHASDRCAHSEAERLAAIAVDAATTPETKAGARLVLARASRGAGNFHRAAQGLEDLLEDVGLTRSQELSALLLLAQTRLDLGLFDDALKSAARAASRAHANGRARADTLTLQTLALQLKSAVLANRRDIAATTYRKLNDLIEAHASCSTEPYTMATVLIAKVPYATYFESSDLALKFLRAFEPHLDRIPYSLCHKLRLSQAAVQLRLGDVSGAQQTMEVAITASRQANDAYGVANLTNNLACVFLEAGDWVKAKLKCKQAFDLYVDLSLDQHSGLSALLNLAHATFYEGQIHKARTIYEDVLSKALKRRIQPWILQARSWLGLIALQLGDRAHAEKLWRELRSTPMSDAEGIDDRFAYEWFSSFMAVIQGTLSGEDAVKQLKTKATEYRATDRLSYTKLLIIAHEAARAWKIEKYVDDWDNKRAVSEEIRWFERVTGRWFRAASTVSVAPYARR